MSEEFEIESDIPLPSEPEDPSEDFEDDDEDPEIPGRRGRKPRCRSNDLHVWEKLNEKEEKCSLCGDIFPCRNEAKCWHYDCWEGRGKVHPWIADGTMVRDVQQTQNDNPTLRPGETEEI